MNHWKHVRDEILLAAQASLQGNAAMSDEARVVESLIGHVYLYLFPDKAANRKTGTVKWFNEGKGVGFIEAASMKDCFLHESEILETSLPPREGQQAEFSVVAGDQGPIACNVKLL